MRVFIAIELPDKIKKELALIQGRMKPTPNKIKWVEPSSLHITLKFLGEIKEEILQNVFRTVEEVAAEFLPFYIEIKGAGTFPDNSNPRVIWMGIEEGASQLSLLARQLEEKLSREGFPPEKRKWVPHLTLGRVKHLRDREDMKKIINQEQETSGGRVKVEKITVMQSRLTPQGAIYTPLQCFSLKGG